jgi:hypothetical protein
MNVHKINEFSFLGLPSLLAASAIVSMLTIGCASADPTAEDPQADEGELAVSSTEHWFYGGPLPALEGARVVVSLEGHTARVTGLVPAGFALDAVPPHTRLAPEGDRTRLDAVYPIATARAGKSDSRPGEYRLADVIPYRPDGIAVTQEEGAHMVTWGGFPFLRYNRGIALHGPITAMGSGRGPDVSVWYLVRGDVSGGCNRMMGEHVVELAHVAGIDMRRVYAKNAQVSPPGAARVSVIEGYDTYDGQFIDVDYPTDAGLTKSTMTRPAKIHGADRVAMFGSWVASAMPGSKDLPPSMKWEGGVSGKPYVFAEHARTDWVCSVAPRHLARLSAWVRANGELPATFCAKKACVLGALERGASPRAACAL